MALGFYKTHVQAFPSIASPRANRRGPPVFSMPAIRNSTTTQAKDLKVAGDYQNKLETMKFLGKDWARDNILPLLKPVENCWQPQDFLPEPSSEDFIDQVHQLKERNKELPDEYFVVLAGDMITEEALPTYVDCHKSTDAWGDGDNNWSVWTRGWSAEENRHGALLNRYLYLSGRVDVKQIEKTIQYLIGAGMAINTGKDPYHGLIYSTFQERATNISHSNTAKLARQYGDTKLAQICGIIAADEKRHETAYCKIVSKAFELDTEGMMVTFADMMRKKISMPAHFMYDGRDENLFAHFSSVAMRIGVYTVADYINILEHLMSVWNVEKLMGLSSQGREAQDFLCGLPKRLKYLEEKAKAKAKNVPPAPIAFSWIFNRQV